jgi:hypothetical protein
MTILKFFLLIIIIFLNYSLFSYSQTFSCDFDKKAACLDYNSKVVDSQATCFNQYSCGLSNNFVCANEYDEVVDKYNDLVKKNNELIDSLKSVINENENIKFCLGYATTLEEVKNCYY